MRSSLPDGLYQVNKYQICAGFVVNHGEVVQCAPILRKKFRYWETIAVRVDNKEEDVSKLPDVTVRNNLAKSLSQQSPETQTFVKEAIAKISGKEAEVVVDYDQQFYDELHEDYDFIIGVTGSRSLQTAPGPHKKEVMDFMRSEFRRLKRERGRILVGTGIAEGFDALSARCAQYEEVDYLAAVPSPTFGQYYWRDHSQTLTNRMAEFDDYLAKAKYVVYVSESHMYGKANFIRNEWLVNFASAFYIYNGKSTGTGHCVGLIKKAGLPHIFVNNHVQMPS